MGRIKNQVLQHLKHASSWLHKAEKEFEADDPVKAEITLSLAQAEVKKAWEVSMLQRMAAYTKHHHVKEWAALKVLKYTGVLVLAGLATFSIPTFIKDNEPILHISKVERHQVVPSKIEVKTAENKDSPTSVKPENNNAYDKMILAKSDSVTNIPKPKLIKSISDKGSEASKTTRVSNVQQERTSQKVEAALVNHPSLPEPSNGVKQEEARVTSEAQARNMNNAPTPAKSNTDNVDMIELVRLAEKKLVETN